MKIKDKVIEICNRYIECPTRTSELSKDQLKIVELVTRRTAVDKEGHILDNKKMLTTEEIYSIRRPVINGFLAILKVYIPEDLKLYAKVAGKHIVEDKELVWQDIHEEYSADPWSTVKDPFIQSIHSIFKEEYQAVRYYKGESRVRIYTSKGETKTVSKFMEDEWEYDRYPQYDGEVKRTKLSEVVSLQYTFDPNIVLKLGGRSYSTLSEEEKYLVRFLCEPRGVILENNKYKIDDSSDKYLLVPSVHIMRLLGSNLTPTANRHHIFADEEINWDNQSSSPKEGEIPTKMYLSSKIPITKHIFQLAVTEAVTYALLRLYHSIKQEIPLTVIQENIQFMCVEYKDQLEKLINALHLFYIEDIYFTISNHPRIERKDLARGTRQFNQSAAKLYLAEFIYYARVGAYTSKLRE